MVKGAFCCAVAAGMVVSAAAATHLPGNVRFRSDFSNGLSDWKLTNYLDLLSVSCGEHDGRSCFSLAMTNRAVDTAWMLASRTFAVTPGAHFAVWLRAQSPDVSMIAPRPDECGTYVEWLDASGERLMTQDALGKSVPWRYRFGFPTLGREWIDSAAEGTVPGAARQARVCIGADTPNVLFGGSMRIAEAAFLERDPDAAWDLHVSRVPDVRDTVGKEDFSAYRGAASTNGVVSFRDDGMTLLDGRPIFPFGPGSVRKCKLNGFSFDTAMAQLKAIGCNLVHGYVRLGTPECEEFVAACARHGLLTMLETADRKSVGAARDREIAGNVARMRNRGVMLAWVVGDDTADHRTPEEVMRDTMVCHAADPTARTISIDAVAYEGRHYPYAHACDAVSPELYPFRNETPEPDALERVVLNQRNAIGDNRRAGATGKGLLPVLQSFSGWRAWKRYPTYDEVRGQTYAAIAAGARGVTYYSYYSPDEASNLCIATRPDKFEEFAALAREVNALSSDLVERDAKEQPAATVVAGPKAAPGGTPSIICLLKESARGEPLLMAVNLAADGVRAEFRVPDGFTRAQVISESRSLPVVDGVLVDDFVRGATHLYRLTRGGRPFVSLRIYGSAAGNGRFLDRAFAAQERHPGLVESMWFSGDDRLEADADALGETVARENLGAKERCRRAGIEFAFQQGITLNHNPDDIPHEGFPDDAWVVDREGKVRSGVFCCTSPFVRDYTRAKAKAVLSRLKPDAYWPDDDLRMVKIGWERPEICFCERCLRLFSEHVGRAYDRARLLSELDEGPAAKPETRRAWCAFNGEMLGEYAKVFREAVDEVSPKTFLGLQAAMGGYTVNGDGLRKVLGAFAGNGTTGVRPGIGHYTDEYPRVMIRKLLRMSREAWQARTLPQTVQVCYEAENWPHVGALKSPGGMMAECALALAGGCDSLALYWGADQNGEFPESHDFWFETLADWKPFLFGVREAFAGCTAGGVAAYFGQDLHASRNWFCTNDPAVTRLGANMLPVTVSEADPDVWLVTASGAETLTRADLAQVFARAALIGPKAFATIVRRFPDLELSRAVELGAVPEERALATGLREAGYECFPNGLKCENVRVCYRPRSTAVERLSELSGDPSSCGTCVAPTGFGGKAVLVQDADCDSPHFSWPGSRRHAILDALDRAVPGGMPVRLVTDGYCGALAVRKTADGRTAGALLANLGTGETPPLEIALRRGVTRNWTVRRPKETAIAAEIVHADANETVIRLPPLPAFGTVLVSRGDS